MSTDTTNHVQEGSVKEQTASNTVDENGNTNDSGNEATALAVAKSNNEKSLNLASKGYIPGNRPVSSSNLKIADSFRSVGGTRPIFASQLKLVDTLVASGTRPVSSSSLAISENYKLMGGNRPIASNEIDEDPAALMGYLD